MSEGAAVKDGRWVLTQEAFEKLLDALAPNRERAALEYELVRRKLIRLFTWRGASFPEELADEAINRVARKLDEGLRIRSEDPFRFFAGVAYLVYKEVLRERERQLAALRHEASYRAQEGDSEAEAEAEERLQRGLDCLEECLDRLEPNNRRFILNYHRGEKRERIENRQRLAQEFEVSMNTLRIRAYRIREKLVACMEKCLGE